MSARFAFRGRGARGRDAARWRYLQDPNTTKRKKAKTIGPTVKGYFFDSLGTFLLWMLELYFALLAAA